MDFGFDELVSRTGLKPRALRQWIAIGIIPPPTARGRYASYTDAHVEAALKAKQMRASGATLGQIRDALHGSVQSNQIQNIVAEQWAHVIIDPDLIIMARGPDALARAVRMANQGKEEKDAPNDSEH